MMQNNFLIIGMGSVGQNYLRALSLKNHLVHYIDLEDKCIEGKGVQFKTWDSIENTYKGIIHCNYAFQRHENFERLRNVRADYHIVEKLCFSSLADIEFFSDTDNYPEALNGASEMYTHLRWNILKIDEYLRSMETELGEICGVNLLGGNLCFSMGGAHWIGLALTLLPGLNDPNTKLFSNIEVNRDSPRSPEIEMLSGQFSLTNKTNYLIAAFDKHSHLGPKFIVSYKYGRIELGLDDSMILSKIKKQNYKPFQYELPCPTIVKNSDFNECPFELLIDQCNDRNGVSFDLGLKVSGLLTKIRIMRESNIGCVLDLGSEVFNKYKDERFMIT